MSGTTSMPPEKNSNKQTPPWYLLAFSMKGKKETDNSFNKEMSSKWKLFGMNLGTIRENWAAWCGLLVAVCLSGVGISYQKDGELARNWDKYGVEIQWRTEGIPQGAIIHINHNFNCSSSSGNHVTFSDGDCAAVDLLKLGATFNGLGGNQNNQVKVSSYPVKAICSVRWPKDYEMPLKVIKSVNCTSGPSEPESTR